MNLNGLKRVSAFTVAFCLGSFGPSGVASMTQCFQLPWGLHSFAALQRQNTLLGDVSEVGMCIARGIRFCAISVNTVVCTTFHKVCFCFTY